MKRYVVKKSQKIMEKYVVKKAKDIVKRVAIILICVILLYRAYNIFNKKG